MFCYIQICDIYTVYCICILLIILDLENNLELNIREEIYSSPIILIDFYISVYTLYIKSVSSSCLTVSFVN